jgi:hypothetical protein
VEKWVGLLERFCCGLGSLFTQKNGGRQPYITDEVLSCAATLAALSPEEYLYPRLLEPFQLVPPAPAPQAHIAGQCCTGTSGPPLTMTPILTQTQSVPVFSRQTSVRLLQAPYRPSAARSNRGGRRAAWRPRCTHCPETHYHPTTTQPASNRAQSSSGYGITDRHGLSSCQLRSSRSILKSASQVQTIKQTKQVRMTSIE